VALLEEMCAKLVREGQYGRGRCSHTSATFLGNEREAQQQAGEGAPPPPPPARGGFPDDGDEVRALSVNGVVVDHTRYAGMNGRAFLRHMPRGAYTAGRTVARRNVFQLDFHVRRLADSHWRMEGLAGPEAVPEARAALRSAEGLRPYVVRALRRTLAEAVARDRRPGLQDQEGDEVEGEDAAKVKVSAGGAQGREYRFIMLLSWNPADADPREHPGDAYFPGGDARDPAYGAGDAEAGLARQAFNLYVLVEALPPAPPGRVLVEVKGAPRTNAAAKDSQWATDRAALEKGQLESGANEVLLVSDDGYMLEGMQSNFYAVKRGRVITADQGVLRGSVRETVLKVCARVGVPVDLTPPLDEEAELWEGCFISSTSRLVLDIARLEFPLEMGRRLPIDYPDTSDAIHKIMEGVANELEADSVRILD